MSEKVIENNKVSVIGEVVSEFKFSHEVFGEGFYVVDMAVSRLSDQVDIIGLYKNKPDFSGRLYLQGTDLQENSSWQGNCRSPAGR